MRSQSDPRYRPDIDGIRAIAVTSVVLFHGGFPPFRSGFVGVDIFFVISGYLIGGIIVREVSQGQFDFVNFYARRARRILPALFLVVLFTCLTGWLLLDASEYRYVGATATSALLAVSNFSFWRFQDYFAPDGRLKPLLMTWSLGVEEQFYFLFPFLIIATAKLAAKRIIAVLATMTLASFALSVWWSYAYPTAAFYLLPSRAWELGIPEAAKSVEAVAALGRGGKCLALFEDAPNFSSECVSPSPDQASVALLGDSHAGALADAFRELATQQNLRFRIFAKSSCRPLLDVGIWSKEYPDLEESCAAFMARSLRVLISDPQVKTVFLAGAWAGPLEPDALYRYVDRENPASPLDGVHLLTKGLQHVSAALRAAGKTVVLVEDAPQWRFDPFRVELDDTMSFRGDVLNVVFREDAQMESGQVKLTSLRETEHTHIILEVMPELPHEARYLDFFGKFCARDYCTYKDSTGLFFFDEGHLSFNGARHAFNGLRLLSDK